MVLQFGTHVTNARKIGNIEQRLLILLCFMAAFWLTSLINLAILEANVDELMNAIICYTSCEALGSGLGSCNYTKQEAYKYDHNVLGSVTDSLIGLVPVALLIFIIDWNAARRFVKKILMRGRQQYSHGWDNERSAAISTFSPAPITSVGNWGDS